MPHPQDQLIVALDFPSTTSAGDFLKQIDGHCKWLKVGMELFYAEGAPLIAELRALDYEVFLDLKIHDIPHTAAAAVRSATRAGASLLTIHAAGGPAMMEAAANAAAQTPNAPRLLAVTVLTSMDAAQLTAIGVSIPPADQVLRLARLAWQSGIRGMVCSAEEVALLRTEFGPEAELVIPGIRPAGSAAGDQKRTATPAEALHRGASKLVIGRPITQAPDPRAAIEAILTGMSEPATNI